MRTLALAATIYALGGWAGAHAAALKTFQTVDPARPPAATDVLTPEGGATTLAAALPKGKPALVNLWATWCVPCVKELPSLARLQTLLGDKAAVVALSVDRGGAHAVGLFLSKTGISGLTVLLDPRAESLQALAARGLPTTLLIDADGREVARYEGPAEWDEPAIADQVRALLKIP